MAAESGDAVIFDPRILHSGSFIFASRLAEAGLLPSATPSPPALEPDVYQPGLLEQLLGKRVRPGVAR